MTFGVILTAFICVIGIKSVFSSTDSKTANIVVFYEEKDSMVSFEAAIEFLKQQSDQSFNVGEITRIPTDDNGNSNTVELMKTICNKLDALTKDNKTRPDIALDFTRIGIPSESVKILTKLLRIPTIATAFGQVDQVREWKNISRVMKRWLVQVSPPADILIEIVRGYALHVKNDRTMATAVVLHDEQFEMHHKYSFLLKDTGTNHLIRPLDFSNLTTLLTKQLNNQMTNFFIAASDEKISQVLADAAETMQSEGIRRSRINWYTISLDDKYPSCESCSTDMQIFHVRPVFIDDRKESMKRSTFIKSKYANIISLRNLTQMFYFDMTVNAISAVRLLKSQGQWKEHNPIYCDSYNESSIEDEVSIDLLRAFKQVQSENLIGPLELKENGRNFPKFNTRTEILQFDANTKKPSSRDFSGNWISGFGEVNQFSNTRIGDSYTHYTVAVVIQHPFIYKEENCKKPDPNDCFYGYCIDLLHEIRKQIPFNYTIQVVKDGHGYMNEANEWDGMVRLLKDKEVDIGLGAFALMMEREKVIDVTVPIYGLTGFTVVMRVDRTKYDLFKFLSVLEADVWYCIVAAFFFTSIIMWFFERFSPYSYRNNPEKYEEDDEKRIFTLRECMWFCMTSLTPQGGGEAPKNLSGRLVAATWWLFGFIIIASYTANLAAFLTVSRLDKPVTSLDDLVKQYRVHYSPIRNSPAWKYFDRMAYVEHRFYEAWKDISLNDSLSDWDRSKLAVWNYPVSDKYTKIWQAMQENKPPENMSVAVTRIIGRKNSSDAFALIAEASDARYQVLMNCDLKIVGEQFSLKPYVIGVQKGSPLKESLSRAITKLQNMRYFEDLNQKWWRKNPHRPFCPRIDKVEEGISAADIGGVFIVVMSGIGLAHFWLLPEYIYYRYTRAKGDIKEMLVTSPDSSNPTSATMRADFAAQFAPPIARTDFKTEYNKYAFTAIFLSYGFSGMNNVKRYFNDAHSGKFLVLATRHISDE